MVTIYRNTLHSAHMIKTFVQEVLPLVDRELDMWKSYAQTKMSGELQKQALASITDKKFHCQGGNFYYIVTLFHVRPYRGDAGGVGRGGVHVSGTVINP